MHLSLTGFVWWNFAKSKQGLHADFFKKEKQFKISVLNDI